MSSMSKSLLGRAWGAVMQLATPNVHNAYEPRPPTPKNEEESEMDGTSYAPIPMNMTMGSKGVASPPPEERRVPPAPPLPGNPRHGDDRPDMRESTPISQSHETYGEDIGFESRGYRAPEGRHVEIQNKRDNNSVGDAGMANTHGKAPAPWQPMAGHTYEHVYTKHPAHRANTMGNGVRNGQEYIEPQPWQGGENDPNEGSHPSYERQRRRDVPPSGPGYEYYMPTGYRESRYTDVPPSRRDTDKNVYQVASYNGDKLREPRYEGEKVPGENKRYSWCSRGSSGSPDRGRDRRVLHNKDGKNMNDVDNSFIHNSRSSRQHRESKRQVSRSPSHASQISYRSRRERRTSVSSSDSDSEGSSMAAARRSPGHQKQIYDKDIPKYNGKYDFRDYLVQFDILAEEYKWTYKEMGKKLSLALTETARKVLRTVDKRYRRDFDTLCSELTALHNMPGGEDLERREMHLMVRDDPNECASKYMQRLKHKAREAYPEGELHEKALIQQFINGLNNPETERHVGLKHPKSLDDAVREACAYESYNASKPSVNSKKPKQINSVSLSASNTEVMQKLSALADKLDKVCSQLAQPQPAPPVPKPPSGSCYKCGQPDHWANKCPQNVNGQRKWANGQNTAGQVNNGQQPQGQRQQYYTGGNGNAHYVDYSSTSHDNPTATGAGYCPASENSLNRPRLSE